jgi:hypothetical protein
MLHKFMKGTWAYADLDIWGSWNQSPWIQLQGQLGFATCQLFPNLKILYRSYNKQECLLPNIVPSVPGPDLSILLYYLVLRTLFPCLLHRRWSKAQSYTTWDPSCQTSQLYASSSAPSDLPAHLSVTCSCSAGVCSVSSVVCDDWRSYVSQTEYTGLCSQQLFVTWNTL